MTREEKRQIEYLKKRREELIDQFIGAAEEINAQIKDVKTGIWRKERKGEEECEKTILLQ